MAVEGNYFSVTRYVGGTFFCQLSLKNAFTLEECVHERILQSAWAGIHNSSNKLAVNFVNWRANSVGTVNMFLRMDILILITLSLYLYKNVYRHKLQS